VLTVRKKTPLEDRARANPAPALCLFGAPLDTGNLGVSALGMATLAGIATHLPNARVTLFDNGRDPRQGHLSLPECDLTYVRRGAWVSRRLHRTESIANMWASALSGGRFNDNIGAMDEADLVLDISAGDSFTDLYGSKRFALVTATKRIALRRGHPLVLLPQTYGPFSDKKRRDIAKRIVAGVTSAWARDSDSYAQLTELLGDDLDGKRHRQGVDVAFALPAVEPCLSERLRTWLADDEPVVGINLSGLLYNDPGRARASFGLLADYPATMRELVARFLGEGLRVLLVPHVRGSAGTAATGSESDDVACERLVRDLGSSEHLQVLPMGLDAAQTKWIIGQVDWFTGPRMHATIAALSTGTPVAGIAYSHKMRGVFATCGLGDGVVDARDTDSADMLDMLWESWTERDRVRRILQASGPGVVDQAQRQFSEMLAL
jgi:colanic acid/amylovoran biosynthesis protein